jgi:hypothetical protein
LATLLTEDSRIQTLPEESTATSCGWLADARAHSVNWPVVTPVFGLVAGLTFAIEGATPMVVVVVRALNTGVNGEIAGAEGVTVPPLDGFS